MIADQKFYVQDDSDSLKRAFSSLTDTMRFLDRMEQLRVEISQLEEERNKKILAFDKMVSNISITVKDFEDVLGKEVVSELATQLSGFSKTATDIVRKKTEQYFDNALKEAKSAEVSQNTKTIKSLESFLAISPFPTLEATIRVSFSNGAYSARCNYRCINDIQYEFSLDTKKNPFFGKEFRLASIEKEVKLPISLGKSLLKKELVPEYEKFDQYVLTELEATETSLITDFSHPEKEATVRIVYSKSGTNPLATVTFKDTQMTVNVTSEPSLNRFLKSEILERAMDRLWLATSELERNKIALTALSCGGKDILSNFDCAEFFTSAWKIIAPALMNAIKEDAKVGNSINQSSLTERFVRDKISLLGDKSSTVLIMLGLE